MISVRLGSSILFKTSSSSVCIKSVSLDLSDKIVLKSDFYLVGKRDVFSYSEPESIDVLEDDKYIYSLPTFVDMNISAEYRYNQKVSAFIQFNNFTAKKYQYWQNFPVQSINILGGITISF